MNKYETTILVTGASGFLGLHCVAQLLEQGYRVRGTQRSSRSTQGIVEALQARDLDTSRLELVEADLQEDAGWAAAAEGCEGVLHVASPFPGAEPRHPDEVVIPARDGALRVLRAASEAGVKRVVMTSSETAVRCGHGEGNDRAFDEDDWSNLEGSLSAYERSKTVAERAAWDFVESLPEGKKLELVTILPTLILGPLMRADASTSGEIVRRMLARQDPGCVDLAFPVVDVRDVAAAHLAALQTDQAHSQRILCGPRESTSMVEIAATLHEHCASRGFPIRQRLLPNWLVRGIALFDGGVALIVPMLGRRPRFSSDRLRTTLGIDLRPEHEAVMAMADTMIEYGVVSAKA